jgi:hypothetical protein
MATTILMFIVIVFAFASIPWFDQVKRYKIYRTDLMAGDEGED